MHQSEYCSDKSIWNIPFICGGVALAGLFAITLVVGNHHSKRQAPTNSGKFNEKIYQQHNQRRASER